MITAVRSEYTGDWWPLPEPIPVPADHDLHEWIIQSWQPIITLDWHLKCEEVRQHAGHLPGTCSC